MAAIKSHQRIPGMGSPEVAENLFNSMFGRVLHEHGGYIALGAKNPMSGEFHQVFCEDVHLAASLATDLYLQGLDTYYTVNPYKKPSRKGESLSAVVGLHVDADSLSDKSLARLESLEPSIIVKSGSKDCYHANILFQTPLEIAQADKAVHLNRRLHEMLKVDSSTSDLTRLLRVPRTLNFKYLDNPRPVDFKVFQPDRRYRIEEVAEMLGVDLSEPQASVFDSMTGERNRFLNSEKRLYIRKLLKEGLFEEASRNYAQLLLTMHYFELGYSCERARREIEGFFRSRHNGLSKDWNNNPSQVSRNINYGVQHWYSKKAASMRGRVYVSKPRELNSKDKDFISKLRLDKNDKAFLREALEWILNNRRNNRVILSWRQITSFKNCHSRNGKSKLELLFNLGIIELEIEYDKKERLANEYRVLYSFSEPGRVKRTKRTITSVEHVERLILEGKSNAEIRKHFPEFSRQRIQSKRKTLNKRVQQAEY